MAAPWIVNLVPAPESSQVKLLKPIRLTVRDSDTFIDPTSIRAVAGYAKIYSNGEKFFDKELPATKRVHLFNKRGTEPTLSITNNGVFLQQYGLAEERTVFTTSIDGGPGLKSVMLTTILRPGSANAESGGGSGGIGGSGPLGPSVFPGPLLPLPFSSGEGGGGGATGGVFIGIENGPRNKVIYLWFQNTGGDRTIRLTSYLTNNVEVPPAIDETYELDWDSYRRYTILWNEAEGFVEVYADDEAGDSQVFKVSISSIPEMPEDYIGRVGGAGSIVALYGLLAVAQNDSVTIKNVAFTKDVGYPIIGTIRPGEFVTKISGTELVRSTGDVDFREAAVSPWLDAPSFQYPNEDDDAVASSTAGIFRMTKQTLNKTFVVHRVEPGFKTTDTEGFMVQARLHAAASMTEGAATGMGFTVFDGQSLYQLQLFQDPNFNTIGLLKKNGTDSDITEHFIPSTNFDWKGGRPFRLVVDPRRGFIELFDCDDLTTPIMTIAFSRASLPSAADLGWEDVAPFISVGHIVPTATVGALLVYELDVNHFYQSWEVRDASPSPQSADPVFSLSQSSSAASKIDDAWHISSTTGGTRKYSRVADFGNQRGAIIEARLRVTSWRPLTRTGVYLLLDDGQRSYALTFVENSVGKFVALSQRSGLGAFQEIVGRDGDAAKISFLFDWTQYHTYRMERRAYDGVAIYVDDESVPRISFPESKLAQLPNPQYGGTPTLGFGHYTTEGAESDWKFVHGLFSRGYDVSFKKNKPDSVLRTELYRTQALIVAHAQDED